MALKRKSVQGQFAAASAVLLAATSSLTRYVRSIHISNDTAANQTWSLAFAATATAAGPGIFGAPIAPNSVADRGYGGQGYRLDNVAISGFALAATAVSYQIVYDESDTVDA